MKTLILSQTPTIIVATLVIVFSTIASEATNNPDSKVIFSVESFEKDAASLNTWTKIISIAHAGKNLSSINITSKSEDVIVSNVESSPNEMRITFISQTSNGAVDSWPFEVSYIDGSGHSKKQLYTANYRNEESPGFTITLDSN